MARDSGLRFRAGGLIMTLANGNIAGGTTLQLRFEGANDQAPMQALDLLPGTINTFIGRDPKNWQTSVHQYARIRAENIYPGIDVVWYGNQHQLEYDLELRPGANPANIHLSIEGSRHLSINSFGDLVIELGIRQRGARPTP